MKWHNFHKLRKYRRKKRNAGKDNFDHLAKLYWRYHWKMYDKHQPLWV